MTPIKFDGCNITFGSNQPQYKPLPAKITEDGVVTTAWQLNDEEMAELCYRQHNGKPLVIFTTQLTFNNPLQPQLLSLEPPPACLSSPLRNPLFVKDQNELEGLAHLRGLSGPILIAMDRKSLPGKAILHFVRMETQVHDDSSLHLPKFTLCNQGVDPRLDLMSFMFQSEPNKALISLLKVVSLCIGVLQSIRLLPTPPAVNEAVKATLAACEQAVKTHG